MGKHTLSELQQRQALPLSIKVAMTKTRIREWINEFGTDGVYISFSGGKDSTVLLNIVREDYPDVEAVFVDVPTQFPELKAFATSFPNVTVLHPKIGYAQVVEKYGFPFISKEVSECVYGAKKYLTQVKSELNLDRQTDRQTDRDTLTTIANLPELANMLNQRMKSKSGGSNQRLAQMLGMYTLQREILPTEIIPNKDRSQYSQEKYKFFLEAPFSICNQCCNVMKKEPAHKYHKETGKVPIIATMASESRLRTQKWIQNGCNGFDLKIPTSTPMSFWTEQDVLLYIKEHNLPICSVYGEVVVDEDQCDGQMCVADFASECGLFDIGNPPLKTTGCQRTGCVLCGFGAHIKGDTRFVDIKRTHPGLYSLIDVIQNNGYTMREAIDWINEHSDIHINY